MSQRDNESIEVARWKKKFLDALEVHDSREKSLLNRIKSLRRGLVGVSLAGEGLDANLDRELASLRSTLRSEENESGIELLLERIERSVLRLDTHKEQSVTSIQRALTLSVKQLQDISLSRELKRAVRQYAKVLPSKVKDPKNHSVLLVDFLELLRMVVRELTLQPETEATESQSGFWSRLFTGASEKPEEPAVAVQAEAAPEAESRTDPAQPKDTVAREPEPKEGTASVERVINAAASSSATKTSDTVSEQGVVAPDPADEVLSTDIAPDENKEQEPTYESEAASTGTQSEAVTAKSGNEEPEPGFSAIANHAEPVLLRILENISVTEKSTPLASKIRAKISTGLNWYEFVAVLEDIYSLITAAMEQERTEFQRFLNELNESLGQVQEYVAFSKGQESASRDSERALDDAVRTQISGIAETVQVAEDIGELKSAVQGQLTTILSSMDQFKAVKSAQQEGASEHTRALEQRLRAMELESKELRLHLAEQEQIASRDALTELPNRAAYDKRVLSEFVQWRNSLAQDSRYSLCLAVCDVDHFKRVNDTYGHLAGDKVLKILAKAISSRLRKTDFVARYGGEEFAIIMPSTSLEDAEPLLNSVRQKIEKCPFHFKETQVQITMSFGLSSFEELDTPEKVFERSDKALYRAKESGRNKVCLA
jgi:diguanylate cyclase